MARDILGTGWKFPIRIDGRGGFMFSREEQSIEEAIWFILSTAPGERIMRPEFGCGINDYVFAPNDVSTRGSLAHLVQETLIRWEPRIDVIDVVVDNQPEQPNLLLIRIDYRIRTNNAHHNMVYPFYIKER